MATITERLKWLIEADASSAIKGFEATGLAAEKNLTKAQTHSQKTGDQLTKVGAGAIAVSAIVGTALIKAAGSFEDLALKAGQMSDATGLSVDQASRWIEVSADMGIGADTIEGALGKMNKTLGNSPEKFDELGIHIATTKTGVEDVNGTFLNTIDRLNQIEDPAARAAAAAGIFGKGWQGSAELLKLSTDDIKTQLQSVSDQKVINEEELQKAKDYRADLDHLHDSAQDLALALGEGAAPVIGAIASAVGTAVQAFTDLDSISHGAAGGVLAVGAAGLGAVGALSVLAGQVIKMKSRFIDAEGALTSFGHAAVGVGVATGIAGLAMIAYTGIASDNAKKKAELVVITNDFVDALKAEKQGQDGAVTALIGKDLADRNLIDNAKKLGLSTQDLADIVTGKAVPAFDAMKDRAENMTGEFAGSVDPVKKNAVAFGEVVAAIDPLKQGLADAKDQIKLTGQVSKDLAGDTEYVAETMVNSQNTAAGYSYALQDVEASTKAQKDATEEATRKSKAFADALQVQIDKLDTLYPQQYDAVKATQDYGDAQRQALQDVAALNTAQGDSKVTTEDVTTATYAARDSIEAAAEKYATMDGAAVGSEGAIRRQIESLTAQTAALDPGSPLRIMLQQYIDQLNAIPSNISTIMDLHISQGSTTTGAGDVIGKRSGHFATGGIVEATPGGRLIVAGEGGVDEAVIPLDGKHSLSGGGNTYAISLTMPMLASGSDYYRAGQMIKNAIAAYERRNG